MQRGGFDAICDKCCFGGATRMHCNEKNCRLPCQPHSGCWLDDDFISPVAPSAVAPQAMPAPKTPAPVAPTVPAYFKGLSADPLWRTCNMQHGGFDAICDKCCFGGATRMHCNEENCRLPCQPHSGCWLDDDFISPVSPAAVAPQAMPATKTPAPMAPTVPAYFKGLSADPFWRTCNMQRGGFDAICDKCCFGGITRHQCNEYNCYLPCQPYSG